MVVCVETRMALIAPPQRYSSLTCVYCIYLGHYGIYDLSFCGTNDLFYIRSSDTHFKAMHVSNLKVTLINKLIHDDEEKAFMIAYRRLIDDIGYTFDNGNKCPKCGAEVKERTLFLTKFVGCLC